MAYAVKYLFKFQSSNGIVREIRVLQDGYSGDVIQRPLGRAPVIKKERNGGVHGTSLTFYAECHIDREYIEFYTSDPKEYRVDVYAGSTLLWQGYITPELYSEPDIAPPYDVQVVATDGVGELKLYDFTPQGTVTLRALLTYLLGHTGLTTDVNLVSSLKPGSHGAGALLDMQICVDYLAGKTCYEALTYLLDTLHATITRWGGAWLLVRETNVTFTNDKVRYFNTSGNSALLAGSVQTLGAMHSAPAWPVGQLSTVIDPAKNKVVVQAPWHPVTCLANPDMASDTGWTKANNASYGPDGYLLPNNDTGGSTYATAHISQALSMAGMRTPMSFELRATGVAAQVGVRVGAVIGVLLTYTVGSTVYLLRKGDEGTPVWKQGSAPGSSIDGSLVDYQQPLASFDADRIQAETLRIDEIPAFVQGTSYPSGTLTVYVVGSCARVYGAHLDVVLPKGYQDILRIDNGARGEGDSVEIAIGRQTADVAYYQAFLQGLLLDSGSLIIGFTDANFTTAMDYLALISRDYALSAALPRALAKGTVCLESSIGMPPLVFAKGGLNYWLETWSWDLYEDELEIDARTLPSASLTVQSETILESDGSTVSSSSAGSSGGGSSISPGGGTNYFQIDEDLQTLLEPKPQFDFLSPKKGLIFESTPEADVASSPAHLMLRNLGTAQSPNYALYTPFALITGGDQIVGSGTPGGGGGGAGYLYELGDIYHDTDKTKVLRTDGTTPAAVGDVLQLTSLTGGNKWAAVPASSIGRIYTGGTGITIGNDNTISVTANTYAPYNSAGYLPLTGGTLSGTNRDLLKINSTDENGPYIAMHLSGTFKGRFGCVANGPFMYNQTSRYEFGVYSSGFFFSLDGGSNAAMLLDTSGRLGIGATPAHKLHVVGNAGWTSKIVGTKSIVNLAHSDGYGLAVESTSSSSSTYLFGCWYGQSTLGSGGNYALFVRGDGNVGVRTSTPAYSLDVAGVSRSYYHYFYHQSQSAEGGYVGCGSSSKRVILQANSGYELWFYSDGSNVGAWTSTGLGIGTSSPSYKLDVNGALNATTVYQNGSSLATILSGYLPLTGGTLTKDDTPLNLKGGSDSARLAFYTSDGTFKSYVMYGWSRMYMTYGQRQIGLNASNAYYSDDNGTTQYVVYHSGNSNKSDVAWSAASLTLPNLGQIIGANSASLLINGSSGGVTSMWLGDNAMDGITLRTGGAITFNTNSTTRAVISSAGNVGIGTNSPTCKLHAVGSSGWTSMIYGADSLVSLAHSSGYGMAVESKASSSSYYLLGCWYGQTTLGTGGNVAFYVRADGNVGIGTNSPGYKLEVNGNIRCKVAVSYYGTGTTSTTLNSSAYQLELGTGGTRSGTIGQYLVGIAFKDLYNYGNGTTYNTYTHAWIGTRLTSTNAAEYADLAFALRTGSNTDPTEVAYLTNAGVWTTTGDQVISSDERLKTIVKPVDMTVEQLAGMRAVIYDRKDSGVRSLGVIAQDWEKVLPESVNQGEYLTFKYAQTAMVSAIVLAKHETEQDKEIRKLREKVQKLEMDNLRLKARLGLEN